jgi:excisionase family DNA binding protein
LNPEIKPSTGKVALLMSTTQVCQYLGISRATLSRLIQRREIPHYKFGGPNRKGGFRVMFKQRDLDRWVELFRVEML